MVTLFIHLNLFSQWVPLIQGLLLLTGLYLGIDRGIKALGSVVTSVHERILVLIPTAVLPGAL
ncbi:MAG: hypothetical protein MJE63_34070 [Proteobacteria bacterium]|nr:hypothetical protein [Pseudomonadota bacterium]